MPLGIDNFLYLKLNPVAKYRYETQLVLVANFTCIKVKKFVAWILTVGEITNVK